MTPGFFIDDMHSFEHRLVKSYLQVKKDFWSKIPGIGTRRMQGGLIIGHKETLVSVISVTHHSPGYCCRKASD